MNAVIYLDVPDWQIGQDVTVYFPDTMAKRGKCELLKEQDDCENCAIAIEDRQPVVRCKDCKYCIKEPNGELYCDILAVGYEPLGSKKVTECWFCADGERRADDA